MQSAITTIQSNLAIVRLELSQVRAKIKLLQPPAVKDDVVASFDMRTDGDAFDEGTIGMDDEKVDADEADGSSESA